MNDEKRIEAARLAGAASEREAIVLWARGLKPEDFPELGDYAPMIVCAALDFANAVEAGTHHRQVDPGGVEDSLLELVDQGQLTMGVGDDGEATFSLTPEGIAGVEAMLADVGLKPEDMKTMDLKEVLDRLGMGDPLRGARPDEAGV